MTATPHKGDPQNFILFLRLLDEDVYGDVASLQEAMRRFGAHKNCHFFQLERPNYKDKAGKSWPVEIGELLPWPLIEAFINQYPDAVEERFQGGDVQKVGIHGKPLEQDGQVFDFKMMLTETVRQRANAADLAGFTDLLAKARRCMALKDSPNVESSGIASPTSWKMWLGQNVAARTAPQFSVGTRPTSRLVQRRVVGDGSPTS